MFQKSKITIFILFMSVAISYTFAQSVIKPDINAIVRQFHVNFSNNQLEENGMLVDENLVVQLNGGAENKVNGFTFKGRDEFVEWLKTLKLTFPDSQIIDNTIIVSGNKAAIRFTFRGTQKGPLQTLNGPIPASGRKVIMHATEFFTFNDSGKLIHLEALTNDLGVITQVTGK